MKAGQGEVVHAISLLAKQPQKTMDKTSVKELYVAPETQVLKLQMEESVLTISGDGARLYGAGVDESNADNNGNIW